MTEEVKILHIPEHYLEEITLKDFMESVVSADIKLITENKNYEVIVL